MISPVMETRGGVMLRKCARATILMADRYAMERIRR
jgi:hypothetical protein